MRLSMRHALVDASNDQTASALETRTKCHTMAAVCGLKQIRADLQDLACYACSEGTVVHRLMDLTDSVAVVDEWELIGGLRIQTETLAQNLVRVTQTAT
jgi:hypothetical protein